MKNKSLLTIVILLIAMSIEAQETGTYTDSRKDKKTYKTVKIGTQTWMAENLAFKTKKGCWAYNNNQDRVATYGFLYDWETAKNVCPSGWHLPSDAEWTILTNYLGGESIAGGKMKESGTTNWESPNADANNKSSFTGLPGGYRDNGGLESGEGTFEDIGIGGNFWSSTEQSASKAWYRYLGNDFGRVGRDYGNKLNGQSVRCIKD